ncbi:MAG TPA: glycosyl hydrolase [Amnibacterium sp.]|jgi:beta-fructofuranosidase|nr:glycosyl hydrolase [Amnibacterium sp.]
MLRLEDAWVWDSWIADDGERYHLFFLKAPSALGDPSLRHAQAVIGHATSVDLVDWRIEPDALGPQPGAWDDLALWTGSTVRGDDGVWHLFYTAISTRGHGLRDQRIGVAESADLVTFRRIGDAPIVVADPGRYRTLDEDESASETWRDPFVFRVPGDDMWHMLITARAKGGTRNADGVLAHATSSDLRSWTVGPALGRAAGFGQIEVPQVRRLDGTWVLVFTCHPQEQTEEHVAEFGRYCTWSVTAESPLGPWELERALPFEAEPALFAAPLVQRRDGGWALLGFRNTEPEGVFAFEIVDPIPVRLEGGRLVAAV